MAPGKMDINIQYGMPSGHKIPALGYGVYQTPANVAEDVVLHAFKTGYRHIDSARVYRNEQPCAAAIRKAKIPRDQIFFTSKVPPRAMGYEKTKDAIESSFKQTGLDYIDLYLIHAPYGGKTARNGTWNALLEAKLAGRIRSIGVSNYGVHHLDELEVHINDLESNFGKGKGGEISVGQWELHPWLMRPDVIEWCEKRRIIAEAYCPLVRGERFDDPKLQKMATKHGKTPAQILIRWSLQKVRSSNHCHWRRNSGIDKRKGFVPLPKSVTLSRIEENANVFDFDLSEEDMMSLETSEYSPCSWDPTKSHD
ncbi:hypothetical protein MMC21_000671 [Puttea exsequens]|nr:hypothetical protein [Puttea exsequens]